MYGCETWTVKKTGAEELVLLVVVLEDSRESLGQEMKPVNLKEMKPEHWKD